MSTPNTLSQRIAGLCFVLFPALFFTTLMMSETLAPGYMLHDTAISDLGVIPESATVFNTSLIAVGVLTVIGTLALWRTQGGVGKIVLLLLAGVGAIGAGSIPLSTPGIHGIFALMAFVFFNLAIFGTAMGEAGLLKWIGFVLGLIGCAYVVIMFFGDSGQPELFGAIGHGGAERMIVYPPMIWFLIYGGGLLKGPTNRA